MTVTAADAKTIGDSCKEAVVDGIINNLSARVSGAGEFRQVIYGIRPSDLLVSGFIVPCPEEDRGTDEEASPLQINAHGLDFHADAAKLNETVRAHLKASVYIRVFPTQAELGPGGILRPTFVLKPEVTRALRAETRSALDELRIELGIDRYKERSHPDWLARQTAVRTKIHASLGIPYEQASNDDAPLNKDQADPEGKDEPAPIDGGNAPPTQYGPDALYEHREPPQKWARVDLDLPVFEFPLVDSTVHSKRVTDELNAAIAAQLKDWFDKSRKTPGSPVGYASRTKILPSHLATWDAYVRQLCAQFPGECYPDFDLRWAISAIADPLRPDRAIVHIAVENWTKEPGGAKAKENEGSVFQVSVSVVLAQGVLKPHLLDRVKPSYRYNQYLRYPALGYNGGVKRSIKDERDLLTTTWTPRYVLPRIVQRDVGVELRFVELAGKEGLAKLDPLVRQYRDVWLKETRETRADVGIEGPNAADLRTSEQAKLEEDLRKWERECQAIETGIKLLQDSAVHWSGPGRQTDPRGIACEAWFAMNAAMEAVGRGKYDSWRLFQLAFIVSMVPTFASRIPAFHAYYRQDVAEDANAVTLLYFATGGGKSEAFLGLLLFVLLLDRLRGKDRGISALMRYPLRLLTLQQARRTMRVLAAGELQRIRRGHGGEPFSLGFWVGSTNTPNWHKDTKEIPTVEKCPLTAHAEETAEAPYPELKKQWRKLETCPFCSSEVALRRAPAREGGVLGHYCMAANDKCEWNQQFKEPKPLPFYIVDEDIYALAPSVLLGTVDKLAVIGQSFRTIRYVFGMFGMAPFRDRLTGRLYTPLLRKDWEHATAEGKEPLFPAYQQGAKAFFDPFPSLLIQDEAHLLEESLGTFAGLFESALDAGLDRLSPILKDQLPLDPHTGKRRRIKVVAASATVSEPERQMRNLYQRDGTIQFPHPGPDLYTSFYAEPKLPTASSVDAARLALELIEQKAYGARTYAAIVTNGHRHTVAMASILGQYHLLITELYENLRSGDAAREALARQALRNWFSDSPLITIHRNALDAATASELLTLIDLHRIALTYVTNKKGGDQVIDTERAEFDSVHQEGGFADQTLQTKLISGAVSASEIQNVVRMAENRVRAGATFPELSTTLRSIIATSAVSHGVDVEEFNAMFFAGLPSDIAEYIQASSRVGRIHVGFSILVPVPQRQRDRFVVEIFDIFHRFLERMVLPAAVDRWAEKAIRRVIPSVMQEYLCGVSRITEIAETADGRKQEIRDFRYTEQVREYLNSVANRDALAQFLIDALGLAVRPPLDALAYYKALVNRELTQHRNDMNEPDLKHTEFRNFFEQRERALRPMTSLRDVDLAGILAESKSDASGKKSYEGMTALAMNFIRRGVVGELDDEDDEEDGTDKKG